ncbi:3-isopropylmalate dehydrogenase [Brevundimonas sp. TWP2-3-4b1]|uniref:3-isopropylmalate dehydrogenase n=1 Tax=Brevundimonas sp. TWP2-3-4b1 TaxID=2804580 RepID=UPI003CF4761C
MVAAFDRSFRLLVLPGDGIGPEIVGQTLRVVERFGAELDIDFQITQGLVGGASIDTNGTPITDAVVDQARASDAILFGAVGGSRWDDRPRATRPEMGILRLRQSLDLFANLRPAVCYSELLDASALRAELIEGLDILIVREATAGVYFGLPRGQAIDADGARRAYDTQAYTEAEIARICHVAFQIARTRQSRVCSVDKANVMETGALWRTVATEVAATYPNVALSHMYADNCAMQLLRQPRQFDVIVTDNLFGDILSDAAAALTGSLGLLPSASLSAPMASGRPRALYEPIHGSAPDIAGQGVANPIGTILSFGLCLRHSLGLSDAADRLERAVRAVLADGVRTRDIAAGRPSVSSAAMTDAILAALDRSSSPELTSNPV